MKKIIIFFLILFCFTLNVHAKPAKRGFLHIIDEFGIKPESVAISIKNLDDGSVKYALNDKIMMNPASVQKILTVPAAINTLGKDYKFSTKLYKTGNSSYLIKLGADPYLETSDLKQFVKKMDRKTTKNIFIDDFVIDSVTWGEGWQWDDNLNILMPHFSSYNINRNLAKLSVLAQEKDTKPLIVNTGKYPLIIFNDMISSDNSSIKVTLNDTTFEGGIKLSGTVEKQANVYIPIPYPKKYFEYELTGLMENYKIYLKSDFIRRKLSKSDIFMAEITHGFDGVYGDTLKNSDNFVTETIFKLAGKKFNGEGSAQSGVAMFHDFCLKNNIDSSEINIVDGSGVSKNNLVNADFVTEYLYKLQDNEVLANMATPGEGTMGKRLLPLKNNLRAKTGTLFGTSSLAGYITTKKGSKYTFCIIQNDVKLSDSDKKLLEDYIIREIYLKL